MANDEERRLDHSDLRDRLVRVEGRLDEAIDQTEKRFDVLERNYRAMDTGLEQLHEEFSRFRGSAGSDLAIARTQLDKLDPITSDQMKTLARGLEMMSRYGKRGMLLLVGAAIGGGAFVEVIQKLITGG